jgi:F-type H+-transporting ATPase subunit b
MSINATLLGQMFTFAIFVFFTMKFVWPVLEQALEERKQKISDGLEAAALGHKKLIEADLESKKKVAEAKKRSEDIVSEALKLATHIVDEARETAKVEKEKIIISGYKSIEQAVSQAKLDLKDNFVELVLLGIEKVLEHSVDKNDQTKRFLGTLFKGL